MFPKICRMDDFNTLQYISLKIVVRWAPQAPFSVSNSNSGAIHDPLVKPDTRDCSTASSSSSLVPLHQILYARQSDQHYTISEYFPISHTVLFIVHKFSWLLAKVFIFKPLLYPTRLIFVTSRQKGILFVHQH